jgi:DNA polymerase, archaea type
VLIIDRNITSYFYAVVKEGFDATVTAKKILDANQTSILKAEPIEKRFFGKPVRAIRVSCKVAIETGKIAKQLRSVEGVKDCLEDDIRIPMRYLIDNNLAPCSWLEMEAHEEQSTINVKADKVYCADSVPKQLEVIDKPDLRVLSFSMISYSREGSPKPERNPVVIISTAASNGEEKQFIADENKNDEAVLEQFVDYICQFDPDVIVSFGGNSQDWNYLVKRSHRLQ